MQKGIKSYGVKGKESVMKEIRNIAEKNDGFGEIDIGSLIEEMKRRALPLLTLMVMKIKDDLKMRGCDMEGVNGHTLIIQNVLLLLLIYLHSNTHVP